MKSPICDFGAPKDACRRISTVTKSLTHLQRDEEVLVICTIRRVRYMPARTSLYEVENTNV